MAIEEQKDTQYYLIVWSVPNENGELLPRTTHGEIDRADEFSLKDKLSNSNPKEINKTKLHAIYFFDTKEERIKFNNAISKPDDNQMKNRYVWLSDFKGSDK